MFWYYLTYTHHNILFKPVTPMQKTFVLRTIQVMHLVPAAVLSITSIPLCLYHYYVGGASNCALSIINLTAVPLYDGVCQIVIIL